MTKQDKILKATHTGELIIGDLRLPCAVLEDGTRVISETGIAIAMGSRSGASRRIKIKAEQNGFRPPLPVFLAPGQLKPYISEDLSSGPLELVKYKSGKRIVQGYRAEILPIVCDIWLRAREDGVLQRQQLRKAQKAEILARALAKVGIVALVDEATGYQYAREYDALRVLVEAYVEEDLRKWTKTFPDSFFVALDKLYGNEKTTSQHRPQYYGKFINRYVYEPLERGYIKRELDRKNITNKGRRKARFHQWLTDYGKNQLIHRLGKIEGMIDATPSLSAFKQKVKNLTQLTLFDLIEEKE